MMIVAGKMQMFDTVLREIYLDVLWMSFAGSRLNVKYFDKDNETGLCHSRLFW